MKQQDIRRLMRAGDQLLDLNSAAKAQQRAVAAQKRADDYAAMKEAVEAMLNASLAAQAAARAARVNDRATNFGPPTLSDVATLAKDIHAQIPPEARVVHLEYAYLSQSSAETAKTRLASLQGLGRHPPRQDGDKTVLTVSMPINPHSEVPSLSVPQEIDSIRSVLEVMGSPTDLFYPAARHGGRGPSTYAVLVQMPSRQDVLEAGGKSDGSSPTRALTSTRGRQGTRVAMSPPMP